MKSSIPTATVPTAQPDFSRIVLIKAIYLSKESNPCWSKEAQNNQNLTGNQSFTLFKVLPLATKTIAASAAPNWGGLPMLV
jgi:hypothetical protein